MWKWRAVVFDLDDTLYAECDFVMSGFHAAAKWSELNLGIDSVAAFQELSALHARGARDRTFDEWLTMRRVKSRETVDELVRVYRNHEPSIEPFPEVPGLLRSLQERYLLGLISDGHLEVQRRKLKALGLERWFDAIVFSDEWGSGAWKPDTLPFLVLLERLDNVPPEEAVYVGDNPAKDFLAARRAGLASVKVERPEGVYGHLGPPTPEHRPDWVVASLRELPAALERFQLLR